MVVDVVVRRIAVMTVLMVHGNFLEMLIGLGRYFVCRLNGMLFFVLLGIFVKAVGRAGNANEIKVNPCFVEVDTFLVELESFFVELESFFVVEMAADRLC